MARIRTIKPEFWRDEKIANLKNKNAALFFIGLWNVADDEGKFPLSPRALSLELPIFRSKEVVTYLSLLSQHGLITESECSQWGLITNWHHQKIDKPKVPKVKLEEIRWLTKRDSTNDPRTIVDESRGVDASIGKDRIGKERIYNTGGEFSEIGKLKETWIQTLAHFGITDRKISPMEEQMIARAIQRWGVETTDQALYGARFEKATEKWNPKEHVSLSRILERDKQGNWRVDKFANLGAQQAKSDPTLDPQLAEFDRQMAEYRAEMAREH